MAVWYLDNDDEITDAVARLRGAQDEHVVFVVPPGSHIATGRLNFKLLAREAESRELRLAIASPDEQVRAMAISAGVLARLTPDEAEAALERGEVVEAEPTPAPAPAMPAVDATVATAQDESGGVLAWRSQRLRITTLVLMALIIVVAVVARQALPSADITLSPRITALGPLDLSVIASADTSEPDPETGRIPATVLPIGLAVEADFRASGTEVSETKATGSVVFSSPSQDSDQEIGEGTRVETPAEIEFRTTETVILQRSQEGVPAEVVAPIEAVLGGETGNVRAGRISVVPTLAGQGISVSNPQATSGGSSQTSPMVEPGDYDDAVENLENLLRGQLKAYVDDPANEPAGLTVFAETRLLGPLMLEPAPESIVGTSTEGFTLASSVEAQVLAVDEAQVDEVTRARLVAALPEGWRLVEGSLAVGHEEGTADGQRITFESRASASTTPDFDTETLLTQVAGLPVSEAQAILDELGTATVNVWPGFMGDLPNDRDRITLDVLEASTTE